MLDTLIIFLSIIMQTWFLLSLVPPGTHEFFVYVSIFGLFSPQEGGFKFSELVFPLGGMAQYFHELLCLLPMSRSAAMICNFLCTTIFLF